MSIETIPGTDIRYHLLALDEDGNERSEGTDGLMSARIAEALRAGNVSDVFVFIHGWKGDLPAAKQQYAAWMSKLMGQAGDIQRAHAARPGFSPLLVGLHWPSLPFGDESLGQGASFAIGAGATDREAEIAAAAAQIADTPAALAALRTIFEAAEQIEFVPTSLPDDVAEAYRTLDQESGLRADGEEGDPGADREAFDAQGAYARGRSEPASFGSGGARKALLSPLVQLSFWKMKARAKRVGEQGGFALLSSLMQASAGRDVRFHLMGHSFGCIAASASVCGPLGSALPRAVNSLVLVQGALSLWSCCDRLPDSNKAGYFRRLATGGAVSGPIVTTRSQHDMAVGSLYPVAAGVARQVEFGPGQALPKYGGVGTFGLRGGGLAIDDLDAGDADFNYGFRPGRIYNVDCNQVIREGGPPSGAHSDIARPEVAHLVWAAALPVF